MQIPWKLKSAAFSVFDVTGQAPLYLAQKYLTRRSRVSFDAVNPSWEFHRANLAEAGAESLVEFGAGKSLAQNLFLSTSGIRQELVDLNAMLDVALVNDAIDRLEAIGVRLKGHVSSFAEIASKYRINYAAPVDMQQTAFAGGSIDACISTNTLEHIPAPVISGIWKEVSRILRPGGIVSAKIDYSDHYAHSDRSISPLNYLTFSGETWRRYNHSCHYQNRLRHQHHLDLLTGAGFEIVSQRALQSVPTDGLNILRDNLTGNDTDFCVAGFVLARKPD